MFGEFWQWFVGWVVGWSSALSCWIEAHPGSAAWAQAFFSVIAIWKAGQLARSQHANERMRERERQDQEKTTAQKRIAGALAAELKGIYNRMDRMQMSRAYRTLAAEIVPARWSRVKLPVFTARMKNTPVYDGSVVLIADLPKELRDRVVAIYSNIKELVDSINGEKDPEEIATKKKYNSYIFDNDAAAEFNEFADTIDICLGCIQQLIKELEMFEAHGGENHRRSGNQASHKRINSAQ